MKRKIYKFSMFVTLGLLFSFVTLLGHASISINLVPNRTSGVGPLSVHFDASATTATGTTKPFRDLDFTWDFDDAGAGTFWNGLSKNSAKGGVVAHVFNNAGTYTVTLTVKSPAGETNSTTVTINVTNPDTYYSGNNTICFSSSGNFTGAPTGSQQVTTSNFLTLQSYVASGKRLLLRRGDTFSSNGSLDLNSLTNITIGAFGSGTSPNSRGMYSNAPIINASNTLIYLSHQDISKLAYDVRIMDLKVNGAAENTAIWGLESPYLLLYKLEIHNSGTMVEFGRSLIDYYNTNGYPGHEYYPNVSIVDCNFYDAIADNGNIMFLSSIKNLVIMGCRLWNATQAQHVVRITLSNKGYINSNEMGYPLDTKHVLKFHAPSFTGSNYSDYNVVSDNYIISNRQWTVDFGPQNDITDERVRNVVFERNYTAVDTYTSKCLMINCSQVTVRNNIMNGYNTSLSGCVEVSQKGIEPQPNDVEVYNNSFYGGTGVIVNSGCTNVVIRNNLQYTGSMISDGAGSTMSNNILATVNPYVSSTPSNATHFVLNSSSQGINAGYTLNSVFEDYVRALRTGTNDVGAYNYGSGGGDTQAPTVPTGLSSSAITQTSFTLSWTASTDNVGVTGYEVFRNGISIGTTTSTSLSVTGLTCNTAYTMTVRARDAVPNWSAQSTGHNRTTSACSGDTQAPTVPTGLSSSAITQTSFTLSWTASTDNVGVTGYEVFRNGVSIGTTTSTSLSVTGLTCNTAYAMTVRARDAVPNWSAQSTAHNRTTSACGGSTNIAPSGTGKIWQDLSTATSNTGATNNTAINNGNLTVNIDFPSVTNMNYWQAAGVTWTTAQSNITSAKFFNGPYDASQNGFYCANFKLQSSTDGTTWTDVSGWTCSPSYPHNSSAGGQTYTISGAALNNIRGIRFVGQVRTAGCVSYDINVYEVEVFSGSSSDTQAPSVPTNLASSAITQTSFTLSWTASTDNVGVTGYEVFRNGVSIGTTTSTSLSVTGLTCNTAYAMTVRARDAVPNWSAQSTAHNRTTSACGTINIAPNGTGKIWQNLSTATSNTGATNNTAINNGNFSVYVDFPSVTNMNYWQAAGVTWTNAQDITSAKFYNGPYDASQNGFYCANFKLQSSTNGTTWTDVTGWTCTPTYPHNSSAGGQTYTISGPTLTGKKGIRFVGQVRTAGCVSYDINVYEVETYSTGLKSAMLEPTLSVTEDLLSGGIEIYPNPAENKVYINLGAYQDATVTFTNQIGQRIYSLENQSGTVNFDVNTLKSGMYYIQVSDKSNHVTKKLIVQ